MNISDKRVLKTRAELDFIENLDFGLHFKKADYQTAFKKYELNEPKENWVQCGFVKKNTKCNELHKNGWVLNTKLEKKVLIGNCCATNYFEKDEELWKDLNSYNNRTLHLEKIKRGREIIGEQEKITREVQQSLDQLKPVIEFISSLEAALGKQVFKEIQNTKSSGGKQYITLAYESEDWLDWKNNPIGYDFEPDRWIAGSKNFWTIQEVNILDGRVIDTKKELEENFRFVSQFFGESGNISDRDLKILPYRLKSINAAIIATKKIVASFKTFKDNDFGRCVMLTRKVSQRVKILQGINSLKGNSVSEKRARDAITKMDRIYVDHFHAHHIRG